MLHVPNVEVLREISAERGLVRRTKEWLEEQQKERKGIHASDLLDPRKAYWDRKHPSPLSDKMVGNFFVGKVLHAFFLSALTKKKGVDWASDGGSTFDKELGVWYSPDHVAKDIPYEFKTSRGKYEQTKANLKGYLEQLLIYMAAKKQTAGRLIVLMLNLPAPKAEGWGTYPQYRAYSVTASKAMIKAYRTNIITVRTLLEKALKKGTPKILPVCKEFKCGRKNCPHYELCKPEGRYGTKRFD